MLLPLGKTFPAKISDSSSLVIFSKLRFSSEANFSLSNNNSGLLTETGFMFSLNAFGSLE